jgi:hypothetical protein
LLTFFGVFLITSGRHRQDHDDQLSDDEDIEETIGLRDQENVGTYTDSTEQARQASTQVISTSTSRRSSHASRTSVSRGGRRFKSQQPMVRPSSRRDDQSTSRSALPTPTDTAPSLLDNPWKNSVENQFIIHPRLQQTISADSVATIHSVVSVAVSESVQSSAGVLAQIHPPSSPERPVTPRPSVLTSRSHSHHHYPNAFISPSPLSSTVSAVVSDTLLRGEDNPVKRKMSTRRLRPTIRSSLFVPHDEDHDVSVADPLLVTNGEGAHIPNEGEPPITGTKTSRGRARSLSNTLGQFFGRRKRRRRNSNPEIGGSQEDEVSGSLDLGQSDID